jgi:outer membrane PBP1 activator LpoA protein
MYATKEYYESKIAYLEDRSAKLEQIKQVIQDEKLATDKPDGHWLIQQIDRILNK